MRAIFFLIFSFPLLLMAGGIEGKVTGKEADGKSNRLAYATVYIEEMQSGTTTNADGFFKIDLPPGNYHVKFQYLGYQSMSKSIAVGSNYEKLDIQLQSIAYELDETLIAGERENPSYTVIRKAIAKAEYHKNQLDSFTAKVYVKGSGRIIDVPFFLRKSMQKEGLDSNMAFNAESIIDVKYERPNTYHQKVISMRSSGFLNENSPINFVLGSFYSDEINGAVSPLSKSAFSFYRFELMETFEDNGHTVNKIRVTPKAKGENVFTGYIYILEDLWSIYSLNLKTLQMGFTTSIQQNYVELQKNLWMPITYQFDMSGKIFGLDMIFNYLTTVGNYQVWENKDLSDFVLIDELVQQDFDSEIDSKEIKKGEVGIQDMEDKKLNRKELMKLMEQYEKEQYKKKKKEGTEDIISSNYFEVDSMAKKKDSTYWDSIRPVPLTEYEKKANVVLDSIQKAKDEKKDSIKKHEGFRLDDIIFGNIYKLNKRDSLQIGIPLEHSLFNTVDGYFLGYRVIYTNRFGENKSIVLSPEAKYNFKRKSFNGQMKAEYKTEDSRLNSFSIAATAGRMESQFNSDEPISPVGNMLITLFLESNFMKIYEKDFLNLSLSKSFKGKFGITASAEYGKRWTLQNHSNSTLIDYKSREFTSNVPQSVEMPDPTFQEHHIFNSTLQLEYQPWLKYRKLNDVLKPIYYSSPTFLLTYISGWNILESEIQYDQLEIGVEHTFELPASRYIDIKLEGGKFLNKKKMYFPDYKHFMGNESLLALLDLVGNFRLLHYYSLSTNDEYATAFVHYHFRKLLLTQLLPLRILGLKENIFINYLYTPHSENYTEIGYGLDNIFRFFRVEAIANFKAAEFSTFGIRIGISTSLIGN